MKIEIDDYGQEALEELELIKVHINQLDKKIKRLDDKFDRIIEFIEMLECECDGDDEKWD